MRGNRSAKASALMRALPRPSCRSGPSERLPSRHSDGSGRAGFQHPAVRDTASLRGSAPRPGGAETAGAGNAQFTLLFCN